MSKQVAANKILLVAASINEAERVRPKSVKTIEFIMVSTTHQAAKATLNLLSDSDDTNK